jgi:Cof subfamily protein (haloacid dehalogenase superfamily)
MPIRLLALDLDGTLLDRRGQVTPRNVEALRQARAAGVEVAIATGRRFRDARPTALEIGIDAPIICHNGALIKHAVSLETIAVTHLPLATAREVLAVGDDQEVEAMVSTDPHGKGLLVYDRIRPDNHALERYLKWSRTIHGDGADDAVRRVDSLEEYLSDDPVHISFSGTCNRMEVMQAALESQLNGLVKVFATIYPHLDFTLLDVLHPSASKGTGLAATASALGLDQSEVMAMGDNFNDVDMLNFAAISVVMNNAAPELKDNPRYLVTESNEDSGVAVAIEKYILNGKQ